MTRSIGRMRWRASGLRAMAAVAVALGVGQAGAQGSTDTYQNPVSLNAAGGPVGMSDPSALVDDGVIYLYGSVGACGDDTRISQCQVPMVSSSDGGKTWATTTFAAFEPNYTAYNRAKFKTRQDDPGMGNVTAPMVIRNPDQTNPARKYIMYFHTDPTRYEYDADGNRLPDPNNPDADKQGKMTCLAIAVSDSPAGPFRPLPNPLNRCSGFLGTTVIDAEAFLDKGEGAEGSWYLYWGSRVTKRRTKLDPNDLTRLAGEPDQDAIVQFKGTDANGKAAEEPSEAVSVMIRNNYYYLFESIGACCFIDNESYQVVVSRKPFVPGNSSAKGEWERLLEPCAPQTDTQKFKPVCKDGKQLKSILKSNADWRRPGSNGIFRLGPSRWWVVYHAARPGVAARPAMIDRMTWAADGWPVINNGQGPSSEAAIPGLPD